MAQRLELGNEDFEAGVRVVCGDEEGNMLISDEVMENLSAEIETLKKNHLELIHQKSRVSEIKIFTR